MFVPKGLGWRRDIPDHRDYSPENKTVAGMLLELQSRRTRPERVDVKEFCSKIPNQKGLNTSTALACVGLVQYFERRANGVLTEPSPLFIYNTSRRLLGWRGDSGSPVRITWKAIRRFGLAAESDWPYQPERIEQEPDAFVYANAQDCSDMHYIRLDQSKDDPGKTLENIKSFLAAGFACVFGFAVPSSITPQAEIRLPTIYDSIRGGQSVMAVGYDDKAAFYSSRGALLIRNSWGTEWGDSGYGWLPYDFIRQHLATDVWTLVRESWLSSGEFRKPSTNNGGVI